MKLWKIGLYICCIIILLYWFLYINKEGFQTSAPPPITTLNVSYAGKYDETYLVAPNVPNLPTFIQLYTDTIKSTGTPAPNTYAQRNGVTDYDYQAGQRNFYVDAYTFEEAKAMCTKFGASLATPDQLSIAAQLGAFSMPAGWGSDGERYSFVPKDVSARFPNTINFTTPGSTSEYRKFSEPYDPLRRFNSTALPPVLKNPAGGSGVDASVMVKKAFPICWGVKPVEPTQFVVNFNQYEYSMFNSDLISYVTNPASTDLIQTTFTPDQAVYALQQTKYNINDEGANRARKFLLGTPDTPTGFGHVNTQIYQTAAGSSQYKEDNDNLTLSPCQILLNTFNNFQTQFKNLRTLMADVSGGVIAMQRAKGENANFQMSLNSICEIESPTSSPACARLATLDYEILYNTDTSDISKTRLATLELLNNNLFSRQTELCVAMQNLFAVQQVMNCTSSNGSLPDCVFKSVGSSDPTWIMNGLQPNDMNYLRILLQEISPYFGVQTYQELIGKILDKLSVMIDMPNLNDYNSSKDRFLLIEKQTKSIQDFLSYGTRPSVV